MLALVQTILEDAKRRQRNLSMAWIDYKKAFDSVPHEWIIETLTTYKISPIIINFLHTYNLIIAFHFWRNLDFV